MKRHKKTLTHHSNHVSTSSTILWIAKCDAKLLRKSQKYIFQEKQENQKNV